MSVTGREMLIREFVLGVLRLMGASLSLPDDELVLTRVRVMKPGGFFSPPRMEEEDLQLVFTREGARRYPTAELVSPGSARLAWFIARARERGFLARGFYAGPSRPEDFLSALTGDRPSRPPGYVWYLGEVVYNPYFLALFRPAFFALEKQEAIWPVFFDLYAGKEVKLPRRPLREIPLTATPPAPWPRLRRRFSWREIWRRLEEVVRGRIIALGPGWYQIGKERLAEELEVLRRYYLAHLAEGRDPAAVRAEYNRRAEEIIAAWGPKVQVELLNGALFYLPLVRGRLLGPNGKAYPFLWRPVEEELIWEDIPPPGVTVNPS